MQIVVLWAELLQSHSLMVLLVVVMVVLLHIHLPLEMAQQAAVAVDGRDQR